MKRLVLAPRLFFDRRRKRSEVDEELSHHLDLMVEDAVAGGMDEAQARADALRRFGDLGRIAEACVEEDTMAERKRHRLERLKGWTDDRAP